MSDHRRRVRVWRLGRHRFLLVQQRDPRVADGLLVLADVLLLEQAVAARLGQGEQLLVQIDLAFLALAIGKRHGDLTAALVAPAAAAASAASPAARLETRPPGCRQRPAAARLEAQASRRW